jgi:arylsulfatase A-like enzyme
MDLRVTTMQKNGAPNSRNAGLNAVTDCLAGKNCCSILQGDITFHYDDDAPGMKSQSKNGSVRRVPWLVLALVWSMIWLAWQGWLLFREVVSPVSSVLERQDWWKQEGSLGLVTGPLIEFLVPAVGLYVLFAWVNASAFCDLLLPRLHRSYHRLIALVGQLFITTLTLSLLGAWLYPRSLMGNELSLLLMTRGGQWFALGLGMAVFVYLMFWLKSGLLRLPRLAQWSVGLLLVIPMAMPLAAARRDQTAYSERPDIILIGVDSLRPDHLPRFGAPFNVAPNIERFVQDSVVFSDALTTQAHTFPATVSILTGLYPTNSGARGNLFPPSLVRTQDSIARRFKSAGWNTVYATDETRFSNIDENYGFEQVTGPGIGVPDYLMSFVSDTVLVNLLANTAPGRWLFPHLYGNRAVAHAYRPESFSRRMEIALDGVDSSPLFLYVHLCSGHWPYQAAPRFHKDQFNDMPEGHLADTNSGYLRAISAADAQVGRLLVGLRDRGRLDNAIVVLFSDHGEDFGMRKDIISNEAGDVLPAGVNGHGSSASREPQVRVLLAWQRYGQTGFASRESSAPVSLVDLSPTLADLAGLPSVYSVQYDGTSLAPTLAGETQGDLEGRTRFVESSKFIGALTAKRIKVADVLEEAGQDFGFGPDGRVEALPRNIANQIALRERTAWSGRQIALLPWDPDAAPVLIDRKLLNWRPAATAPDQAAPLLAKVCEHWRSDVVTASRCADWLTPSNAAAIAPQAADLR